MNVFWQNQKLEREKGVQEIKTTEKGRGSVISGRKKWYEMIM